MVSQLLCDLTDAAGRAGRCACAEGV